MLNQASLFGEFDEVQGVTENILLGQVRRVLCCWLGGIGMSWLDIDMGVTDRH